MQEYTNKEDLIHSINKAADQFIQEFEDVTQVDIDMRFEEVDRTPREMIAYQLGWMELIRSWDRDELSGNGFILILPHLLNLFEVKSVSGKRCGGSKQKFDVAYR